MSIHTIHNKFYNSQPEEIQKLITDVFFTTIDMCNEMLKGEEHIVFFEYMAYKMMLTEMLEHMENKEWFDALGDMTWKKEGEKTSWDGKFPIKHKTEDNEN